MKVEFIEHLKDNPVQLIDIGREGKTRSLQGHGQVSRKLAGQMKHAATTAIHPVDIDSQSTQCFVVGDDVEPAAGPSHAECGRVFTEYQRGGSELLDVVNQASLKRLDFLEVGHSQQV